MFDNDFQHNQKEGEINFYQWAFSTNQPE